MNKVRVAEELAENLQEYANETEEGEREQHNDSYLVDGLCDMHEIIYKDGSEEGRYYQSYMLKTDKVVKLFETIEITKFMSGSTEKLKVMSILEVKPLSDKTMSIEFLGQKVRD